MLLSKVRTNTKNDLVGLCVGRYHIQKRLNEDEIATGYCAYDTCMECEVAIMFIRIDNIAPAVLEGMPNRFEVEAKALIRMNHACIVKVYNYGEYKGMPYLVMQYVPGGTLKEKMDVALPAPEAARLLLPVGRALIYAHRKGIVHGDIKPANILINSKGDPLLSGFGMTSLLGGIVDTQFTHTGCEIGTPDYMAPEQHLGEPSDPRMDIYALGIIFYELVAGQRPFADNTSRDIKIKQVTDPLADPQQVSQDLSEQAERVIFKALAEKPENRYQTMAEFVAAMDEISRQPVKCQGRATQLGSGRAGQLKQEAVSTRRKTLLLNAWIVLTAILLLGGATGVSIWLLATRSTFAPLTQATSLPMAQPTIAASTRMTTIITNAAKTASTQSTLATLAPNIIYTNEVCSHIGQTQTSIIDGMVQVCVPAGEFKMGSEDGDSDVRPVHSVYLHAFWIDKTEVTNAMYGLCVQAGVCKELENKGQNQRKNNFGYVSFDNYPVISTDWYMAKAFCEWIGGNLPSEAQWEKAARGTDGRNFPWGNDVPDCSYANYDCGLSRVNDTHKAGSYVKGTSPFGVLDMAGNVWEWVLDWYDENYYINSPTGDPQGPSSGRYRVLRGGSWYLGASPLSSTRRSSHLPILRSNYVGFRCVSSVASP